MRVFICEKPSQGKDIARVLGADKRGDGCYIGQALTVTWCIGHLIEAVPPEAYGAQYKRWSLDQLPIIPTQWRVAVKPAMSAQFRIVKRILRDASEVIIATDADREGEMIGREILEICNYRGPVQRLWLSALNDASIRAALTHLRPGHDTLPLYYAALARSRADWLVGMNLSRLFTLLGQTAGQRAVLSVGRVQTPTLSLVVRRDREIAAFVAKPYFVVIVRLRTEARAIFETQWMPPPAVSDGDGHCISQTAASAAAVHIRNRRAAVVTSVQKQRVREAPPLPLDLSTLQQVCSRRFGLDVQESLRIAQSLYETHKATTYPRTDCGYLPSTMIAEIPRVVEALRVSDPSLTSVLRTLDYTQRSRAWDDAKITAHHGIIPTVEPVRLTAMSEMELEVYRLIRSHYLAQFMPHHEFDRTVAQFDCDDARLVARGKKVAVEGWRSLFPGLPFEREPDETRAEAQDLPRLVEGQACDVEGVDLKALKTSPPKHYTQGELIKDMRNVARFVTDPRLKQKLRETSGIGTVATQAPIVQGLIDRKFVSKKGASIRASDAGAALIDAIPPAVADPGTSAMWEEALDRVATGRMTLDEFVDKQSKWVAQIVRAYANAPVEAREKP